MTDLSIVIPTSGPRYVDRLTNCLSSIRQQEFSGTVEVLITYMYRAGETPDFSWFQGLGVSVIPCEYTAPAWVPALSRNVGFRRSTGGVLASVDADSYLHPGTFSALASIVGKKTFVTVRTRMLGYPPSHEMFKAPLRRELFTAHRNESKFGDGPGCIIAATRRSVYAIRGWDERFIGYGAADHDFVNRLRKLGLRQVDLPTASCDVYTIHQYHAPSWKAANETLRRRNHQYYDQNKAARNPTRNDRFWGAWPRR